MNNMLTYIPSFILIASIAFYLMQNLQWYNYSFIRILTKHSKPYWHFIYLILPVCLFFILKGYFYIYLIVHLLALFWWYYKLDKKLVWTNRVKIFFIIFFTLLIIDFIIVVSYDLPSYLLFVALVLAFIISIIEQLVVMYRYKQLALKKLQSMPNLKIIAITASFGKTSIKNFINELLSKHYNTYATPRSVNTIAGIINDINNNLAPDTEIYIVEAGARQIGDIDKIAKLINHQYAVIGEIGEAHIEYFRSIENTKRAKYELLNSANLKQLFLYKDNEIPNINAKVTTFPTKLKDISSTLQATSFKLKINNEFVEFETKILGKFNITNISVAILLAHSFNIDIKDIQKSVRNLKPIEHRLEKIEANNKIIIDDSFNGNLAGMSEAIRLSNLYQDGKKIIVTPGLVESNEENNKKLAKLIDDTFDVAIITGEINTKILVQNINNTQKVIIKDKNNLNNILSSFSKSGDLILFANDAPNYI